MTLVLFLTLLAAFATASGIITQGIKELLKAAKCNFSSNILAAIVSCIVGVGGTAGYYLVTDISFDTTNIICMCAMGLATSLGAMVGYDKVVQAIQQMFKKG